MASTFGARLKHAWNAFKRDPNTIYKNEYRDYGQSFMYRPDRLHLTRGPDKTIIASIYNRISMDVAAIKVEHVQLDEEDRYIYTIKSPLNNCLTLEANIDQTGRTFIQDAVLTMLDNGCVALVPTETDIDPTNKDGATFDIISMRVATIKQWYPKHVQVDIYNEETGQHSQYTLPKSMLAIVENPFYPVMNEPNSTMQRLIRKLTILDAIDEQTGSGKLDMIIQLPYVIKSAERRKQAEARRKDLERQLSESKYGVAYADGTEKIVQLNKPLENNLLSTIEYLTSMLYSQLGITTGILDGTADEQTMLNYNNRVVEPILSVLTDELKRKFLTKNARTRHQSIKFFIQPFRALPISNVADLANSLARNEIVTPNEFRQILGMKPAAEPQADELHNANMPGGDQAGASVPSDEELLALLEQGGQESPTELSDDVEANAEGIDAQLDELEELLAHSDDLMHYLPTPSTYASKYYDPEKAHEYYMKNRELKERKSTKTLNEKGMEVADYVKSKIDEEKQGKLSEAQSVYDRLLALLKEQKAADTQENNETTADKIKAAQNAKDSTVEKVTNQSRSDIEGIANKAKTDTERINEKAASDIENINQTAKSDSENAKNKRDAQIKQNQEKMQSSIDTLKARLQGMTATQKAKNRNKIQAEIDKLRKDNASDKEKIQATYTSETADIQTKKKSDTTDVRTGQKTERASVQTAKKADTAKVRESAAEKKAAARTEYKETSSEAREIRKSTQKIINDNFSKSVADLKADTKNEKLKIGEEYTEKWLKELDKIKSVSEYLKPPKTPKAKAAKKTKEKKKKQAYRPFWWL